MDFKNYENTMPYPSMKDCLKLAEIEVMSNKNMFATLKDLTDTMNELAQKIYKREINKYNREQDRLHEEFKAAALAKAGYERFPKRVQDAAFQRALDYGHGCGYNEVYSHLEDLYDFIVTIIEESR